MSKQIVQRPREAVKTPTRIDSPGSSSELPRDPRALLREISALAREVAGTHNPEVARIGLQVLGLQTKTLSAMAEAAR